MKGIMKLLITAVLLVSVCVIALGETVTNELSVDTYTDLEKGSKGESVKVLQVRLKELGYYTSSIDGDYGNGTKQAVSAFQSRNGLAVDGIATIAVQEILFSDDAKMAPMPPKVHPIRMYLGNDGTAAYTKNDTDETIDTVRYVHVMRDQNDRLVSDQALTYVTNFMTKDWGVSEAIKAGRTGMLWGNTDWGYVYAVAKRWGVGLISYHTESGENVYYTPKDITFYYSDGTIVYPEDDAEPYIVTDEELRELSSIQLGITSKMIYPWTAEFYAIPEGIYVYEVTPGGLADKAGMKAGDIITLIDGNSSLEVKADHDARRKLLAGEEVEYTYSRSGSINTVLISADMETVSDSEQRAASESTIGEELLRYGELLEKGLITQTEYDDLKQKLIYG